MHIECDYAIVFSFFLSFSLREFPSEQNFLFAKKIYAKAYKWRNVLRKTQASGRICVGFMHMLGNELRFGSMQCLTYKNTLL